jgi:hypothetical protein
MVKKDVTIKRPQPTNQTFQERGTTVARYHERKSHIPWLRIRGHWLALAGFTPTTKVRIRVMTGCLVITKE